MEKIYFKDVKNYAEAHNTIVIMGFSDLGDVPFEELTNNLTNDIPILENGAKVIGVYKILGNKLGEEGRTDWLVELDKFNVNVIARFATDFIKLTEDFIVNYKNDYKD